MKRIITPIICLISICIILCGCNNEYENLNIELDECHDEINYLEDKILETKSSLNIVLDYVKNPKTTDGIETLSFNETWGLKDYFDFSFCYDDESKSVFFTIKDKSGNPIRLIWEDTPQIQELLIAIYSSDGELETYYGTGYSEMLFLVPEYNYSYEILLFATVNNDIYRANYNF